MLNYFCTIAERLAVSSLDISENVGTIYELYSENVGTIHDLYSKNVGTIHDLYSKNVGTIHDLYSKNVGTIHELSLPRVSGYAYLIFGNIYSLSSGIIGISVMI